MGGVDHLSPILMMHVLCNYTFEFVVDDVLFSLQVLIGGGQNHRMGLFDMVMIKDNHVSIAGGVINAIRAVDQYLEKRNLRMEVEVVS